jgi:hypothetical protein
MVHYNVMETGAHSVSTKTEVSVPTGSQPSVRAETGKCRQGIQAAADCSVGSF